MMRRMRHNPILLSDDVLVALDKLEDLGAPTQYILGQIKNFESPDTEYDNLLNWLRQMERHGDGPNKAAWHRRLPYYEAAIRATERAWDALWFDEHALGREQIEAVFSLTGGELAGGRWYYQAWQNAGRTDEDDAWYDGLPPDRRGVRGGGGAIGFWYEGLPEYAFDDKRWPAADSDGPLYRTIVTDWGGPGSSLQPGGRLFHAEIIDWDGPTWRYQTSYRSRAEAECPGADFEGRVSTKTAARGYDGRICPLCEAEIGAAHGAIYLGEGWGEFVYLLEGSVPPQ